MPWIVTMDWIDALFLHWPVAPAVVRDRIPAGVAVDTFGGDAWVSIVAFRIAGARLRGVPHALAMRTFPEVNVRTYVVHDGHPAVWFLSLDADSTLACALGRTFAKLAYQRARASVVADADRTSYRFERTQRDAPAARFEAVADAPGGERPAAVNTVDAWLVERLSFVTVERGRVLRVDVAHAPWPLREPSRVDIAGNTLLDAARVSAAGAHALAHVSRGVSVRAWPPR